MNNELHKINLTGWVIGVSAFIVNVIIIFIIISSASDMSGETSNPVSDSEGFLMSTYTQDVSNGEKITTFSAQVYNQTWLKTNNVKSNKIYSTYRLPNLSTNFTLLSWIKPYNGSTDIGYIISQYYLGSNNTGLAFRRYGNTLQIYIDENGYMNNSDNSLTNGTIHLVGLSFNGTRYNIFIDNNKIYSQDASYPDFITNYSLRGTLTLGNRYISGGLDRHFNGEIRSFKLINNELSEQQIGDIYNDGL